MNDDIIVQEDLTKKSYQLSMRAHRAYRMIYFVLGVIEAFLLIRFFFKLFGANPSNVFVSFVYFLSGVLMLPFTGVFQSSAPVEPGVVRVFEPSTLVAAIIFALLAWGLSRLLLIVRSKPLQEREV